jgi:DNA gyrase subunit B
MHPDTRRLVRVNPTDVEETAHIFDVLLGDDLDGRKRIIAEHGAEYLDMLDLA